MSAPINRKDLNFHLPDMLSYHSTWDDADYEPVERHRRPRWTARMLRAPRRWLARRMEQHWVIEELHGLSDRELSDMGLSRYDIGRVFDPGFSADRPPRPYI